MPNPTPTPQTMTVKVTLGYVRGCAACESIARDLASSAICDPSVTGFAALPGRRHACGAADVAAALPSPATGHVDRVALDAAGQGHLPLPTSGLNGFDA